MRLPAVDDVGLLRTALDSPNAGFHLGDHAAFDYAVLNQPLEVGDGEIGDLRMDLIENFTR